MPENLTQEATKDAPATFAKAVFRFTILVVAAIFAIGLVWLNVRLYAVPKGSAERGVVAEDALAQLANIGRRLRAGEGADMQMIFPEGWFFSHALYGFAWVNVGLKTPDPALKQLAVDEVRWVLQRMDTPEGLACFMADTQVEHGVFYLGWKNRLLGGLLALKPESGPTPGEIGSFHRMSAQLAEGFRTTPTRHLDAYPGQSWPCDNVMALSSLRLHDELFDPQFGDVIQSWLAFTREHLDPQTGLMPHMIDGRTGAALIRPRASTQVYMHTVLPELDAGFAREQYARFRELYVQDWLGFLPVREYPIGSSGSGDVDTGPLVFGLSPSATVVSIAAARANGDFELAERTVILSEMFGAPWTSEGEKSFGFGSIVVADAFLVWGKTLVPWTRTPEASFPPTTITWWRWRLHGISLLLLAAVVWIVRKIRRPRIPVERHRD